MTSLLIYLISCRSSIRESEFGTPCMTISVSEVSWWTDKAHGIRLRSYPTFVKWQAAKWFSIQVIKIVPNRSAMAERD